MNRFASGTNNCASTHKHNTETLYFIKIQQTALTTQWEIQENSDFKFRQRSI